MLLANIAATINPDAAAGDVPAWFVAKIHGIVQPWPFALFVNVEARVVIAMASRSEQS